MSSDPVKDMDLGDVERLFASRCSVRRFLDRPVPRELILELVRLGCLAPSGQNRQPWDFHVLTTRTRISALAGMVRAKMDVLAGLMDEDRRALLAAYSKYVDFFGAAPAVIATFARPYAGFRQLLPDRCETARLALLTDTTHVQSAAAAVTQLLLAASASGLGACWITSALVASEEIAQFFRVGEPWELVCLVAIGWPAEDEPGGTALPAKKRHPPERIVHFDD